MHTQPQASWSLRKGKGNPCDTTLLPHHQPIRELYTVQFSSVAQSCPTLCDPMNRSMPGLPVTNTRGSLKLTSIESVMPSSHPILCHLLLLLPSIFPSIRVFFLVSQFFVSGGQSTGVSASKSALSMNIQDFRMYWFDLLAVQGTLKSLLQHLTLKVSTLWCSAFYGPTLTSIHDSWKNHSFDYLDFCQQSDASAF